jgi:hypothetical protein
MMGCTAANACVAAHSWKHEDSMKLSKHLTLFLAFAMLASAVISGQSAPPTASYSAPQASTATSGIKVDAVRAKIILKTALTSRNAPPGKPVKAVLKQAVTLPNGDVLPKETVVFGTVLASNKHSKDKPNGTLVLEFHRAAPKGHNPVQLIVRIQTLAPSEESENATTTLPNSNGNMVALAGNSGGSHQVVGELNDRSDLNGKHLDSSSIEGVHLGPSAQGGGAIFSFGEDVFLDEDVQMTVLMAPVPEKTQ